MRPSPLRHRLAVLRTTLRLTQKELASLVGCSTPTIQAIELGKLKLSESLAERIALQTGAALFWLLGDSDVAEPHDSTLDPITRETFERAQAELSRPQTTAGDMHRIKETFVEAIHLCGMTLLSAYEQGKVDLGVYRLLSVLKKLAQQDPETQIPLEHHMFSLHQKHNWARHRPQPHVAVRSWYRLFAEAEAECTKSPSTSPGKDPAGANPKVAHKKTEAAPRKR